MTTPAQRERTQLRTKLYTGRQIPNKGRGGGDIDESDLLQMWPKHLDMERSAAKRTLSLPDVAAMLENQQTPVFNALQPRPLSEREVAVIRAWHSKAEEQQRKDLGDALAAAQSNIMVHTTTQADRVIQEVRREVPQAVQGIIAEELDKRIGPPPQGTMEEALADRKHLNQRIQQLRKEAEENAKPEEELFGDVKEPAATVSDNGRESAKKRARIETPSGEEKQRRAQKRARPAETQSARGPSSLPSQALRNLGTSAVDATTENELKRKIASGLKEDFMSPEEAQALCEFCKELLPEATRIHTGQFKILSKQAPKLFCYDVDADGWSPQYKFADMAPVDYHLQHSAINGTPLQGLVQRVKETYGADVNHIVINCYPFFSAYIPTHKDQPLSLKSLSNKYETNDDVFIYSLGADRWLCFVKDTGAKQLWGRKLRSEMDILSEVKTSHNSMYVLSGHVNQSCLHAQPMEHSENKPEELRFSITCRVARRLKVNTRLGKYEHFNGKKWETRDLPNLP